MQGIVKASTAHAAAGASAPTGGVAGIAAEDSAGAGTNLFGAILAGQLKGRTVAVKIGADGQLGVADLGNGLSQKTKELVGGDIAVAADALADMLALASSGLLPIVVPPPAQADSGPVAEGQALLSEWVSELAPGVQVAADAGKLGGSVRKTDLGVDGDTGKPLISGAEVFVEDKVGVAEIAADGKTQPVRESLAVEVPKAASEIKGKDFVASLDRAVSAQVGVGGDAGVQGAAMQGAAMQVGQAAGVRQEVSSQSQAYTVAPPVGSSEWGGALGDKVTWIASQGTQTAELQLNPPNLGPLEVRVTVGADQQASVLFVSHQPAVREALETAMPRLREMLADSGVMLGNSMVGAETFQQQQQQQAHSQKSGGGSGKSGVAEGDVLSGVSEVAGLSGAGGQGRSGRGMVDMFV